MAISQIKFQVDQSVSLKVNPETLITPVTPCICKQMMKKHHPPLPPTSNNYSMLKMNIT
jgi:hypothetical protein